MPNERHYNELNLESVGINLPYNMQAEQSVLGAVLLKPETLTDLVEIIRPEMFYTRQNAQIYSEMLRLFTSDQTIDFVTLLDAVISDGVFPSADEAKIYLTGLAETVPSISNVKAYAQIVQEKYLVRQLMGVAKDILQDAGDEPDADLLLENAVRDHRIQQRHKVDGLVGGKQPQHLGVNLRVLPGVEHLGPDDLHQVRQRLGFEQHRAQHALLRLHVVRQVDAHALQIQFIGIMSFVRHNFFLRSSVSKAKKRPLPLRGRRQALCRCSGIRPVPLPLGS